jgi:titin
LRDNGIGDAIDEDVDSATIANKPSLFEHTVDMTSYTGMQVRFKLQVTNEMGTTTSTGYLTALVAGIPPTPAEVTINTYETSGSQLSFTIPEITDDGGSYIDTYHVEMDDGESGEFVTISGYPEDSLKTHFVITSGIQLSNTYGVRYRVRNSIGWSEYSDVTYILAAESPSRPSRPTYISSTSTQLVIEFGTSDSNGGAEITSYTIQVDKEDGSGFVDLSAYTESTTTQTLTIDGADASALQPGQFYRFRSYATNSASFTGYSYELRIAAAQLPSQPSSGPEWVESLSTITSIGVTWDAIANTEIDTTGYKLYRDGGNDGEFELVYNGVNRPGRRTFVSENLTQGTYYRFKYSALNFNGEGTESDEVLIPACLSPSGLSSPVFTSGTSTTITLEWSAPTYLGGCDLTGFKLYQGTTADSTLTTEVDTALNDNPSAREYTITFSGTDAGTVYRFQLEAITRAGSVKSGVTQVKLAAVPDAPPTGPSKIASRTNDTHITVEILSDTQNYNGGTLKRVNVQMDNGGDGEYFDIIGPDETCVDTIFTISDNIVSGRTYQFRYRIMNENGWSDFCPVTTVTAASTPSSPPKPSLVSATASQISLAFSRPDYNGGASITKYELYIND